MLAKKMVCGVFVVLTLTIYLSIETSALAAQTTTADLLITVTDSTTGNPLPGITVGITAPTNLTTQNNVPGCYDCHIPSQIGLLSRSVTGGQYFHYIGGITDEYGVYKIGGLPGGIKINIHVIQQNTTPTPPIIYQMEFLERVTLGRGKVNNFDFALDPILVPK